MNMMNMDFKRKLPIPMETKEMYPLSDELSGVIEKRTAELKAIFEGESDKMALIIGPCSADNEEAVLDYMGRLQKVQEKVADRIYMIPRVYTNKPRTVGLGYKGMLHQPNPEEGEDLLAGIIAIRQMHTHVVEQTGFTCAEEMLYPENHRYLSDLLAYVAIGARSVEDQGHRLVASGLGIPAGMKNPTGGDISVMMNSIVAAQNPQRFVYRGWEVQTTGNPLVHSILRGYVDKFGRNIPNYHFEDLIHLYDSYMEREVQNPAVIIDTNHSNSDKDPLQQIRIAKDVIHSRKHADEIIELYDLL